MKVAGAVQIILVITVLLISTLTVLTGGATSPFITWYLILPVWAGLACGAGSALFYSAVTLVVTSVFYFYARHGGPFEPFLLSGETRGLLFVIELGIFTAVTLFYIKHRLEKKRKIVARVETPDNSVNLANQNFQLLAHASHEIRTPLSGISGMLQLLIDADLTEEQEKYARSANNSTRALLKILNNILDYSKIEAGKLTLERIDFDLQILVDDIMNIFSAQVAKKRVGLFCRTDCEVPVLINSDPGLLRQVFTNLISNAIKFTAEGEIVLAISVVSEDESSVVIRFEVSDTGIGIPEEKLPELFSAYVQAFSSTAREYGGTGLGLSISKQLVSLMGGEIEVVSEEDRGTSFSFELPFMKQAEGANAFPPTMGGREETRILVVTPVAAVGDNFEESLNPMGFSVTRESDPASAVRAMELFSDGGTPFHIALVDADHSEEDAKAFASMVSHTGYGIGMMLTTSIGQKGDSQRFHDMGYCAYLSKPVEDWVLRESLETLASCQKQGVSCSMITRHSVMEGRKYRAKILLAEDNKTNAIIAVELIKKMGYQEPRVVENGKMAVHEAAFSGYDLILMDCHMPLMDGYEAASRIRDSEREGWRIPIIAMTANVFEEERQKCLDAGMDDHIAKPVDPTELALLLKKHLKSSRGGELRSEEPLVFDRQKMLERFGGSEELLDIIAESFKEEIPPLLDEIRGSISIGNAEQVKLHGHALRGSAANINADALEKAAGHLEEAALGKGMDEAARILGKIESEFEKLSKVLK